jgi:hypothetical protein
VEVQRICGLHQQPPSGGRSGGDVDNTSLTSRTIRQLMSIKEKILKDNKSLLGRNIMDLTRDGELSMLTNIPRLEQVDMTENMDSISIEHSTSDQDFQCGELLKMYPIT